MSESEQDEHTDARTPPLSSAEQLREAEAVRISMRRRFEGLPGPGRPAAA